MSPERARRLLAAIRLVNGTLALVVPGVVSRRLGSDPRRDPAAIYPLRLFGIRTVLLGSELLLLEGDQRRRAIEFAVAIHATDTASAALAGLRGQLPRRAAIAATLISATNTALAAVALQE